MLGIGMMTQIPLCVLHLIDLGVTRKIITFYTKKVMNKKTKFRFSERLIDCGKFCPAEFNGKTKSLPELANWKRHDFRRFIFYEGPSLLRGLMEEHIYNHFILVHAGYRLLFMPDSISNALLYNKCRVLLEATINF